MRPKPCAILVLSALAMPAGAAETEANAIFLVAAREMRDPRFREAVVLVTQPRQGGPWGVIVNKPLGRRLAEVITDHESLKNSKDVVYFGGPVSPQGLVFLVRSAQPPARAVAVLQGVYFTSDADWIGRRLRGPDPHVVVLLRQRAGWVIWRYRLNKASITTPCIAGDYIFTGSIDGQIVCVDIRSAKEVWNFATENQVTGSPIVYKDSLYCGSVDGNLYCLEFRTGRLRWKFRTKGPITGTPIAVDDLVYIGSTDHCIYALLA